MLFPETYLVIIAKKYLIGSINKNTFFSKRINIEGDESESLLSIAVCAPDGEIPPLFILVTIVIVQNGKLNIFRVVTGTGVKELSRST